MKKQELNQYIIDNQKEIIYIIASSLEGGVNSETLEMADYAHSKMIDLIDEKYDENEELELTSLNMIIFDAMKECGYFVKSGNSIADKMAAYHEERNERYNPMTKSFEKIN